MAAENSRTYENLTEAFVQECIKFTEYTIFSKKAEEDGFYQIGEIFSKTAYNEFIHAQIILEMLGGIKYTSQNLIYSAQRKNEKSAMYKEFARIAKEDRYSPLSQLFERLSETEKKHGEIFRKLADNMDTAKIFCRDKKQTWVCRKCGYETVDWCSREKCPLCGSPQDYSEIKAENY